MTLHTINIDLPADILLTLNESEEELKKRIKISLAIQLYAQQKVTDWQSGSNCGNAPLTV